MKFNMSTDLKLNGYGFKKEIETNEYVKYVRHNNEFNYDYIVELSYRSDLKTCVLNAYIPNLYESYKSCMEALTYEEVKLFLEKMSTMQEHFVLT